MTVDILWVFLLQSVIWYHGACRLEQPSLRFVYVLLKPGSSNVAFKPSFELNLVAVFFDEVLVLLSRHMQFYFPSVVNLLLILYVGQSHYEISQLYKWDKYILNKNWLLEFKTKTTQHSLEAALRTILYSINII